MFDGAETGAECNFLPRAEPAGFMETAVYLASRRGREDLRWTQAALSHQSPAAIKVITLSMDNMDY